MHIEVRGVGPPLVLLHGWAMHSGIFESLSSRLAKCFSLYLVDLPGHGRSADSEVPLALEAVAGEIIAQLARHGHARAHWLGWSLGGLVALHAAQQHPQSIMKLVMVAATPRFVAADDWSDGVADQVFATFAEELAGDYRATIDRFLMLEAQGSDHVRAEIRALRDQVFAHGQPNADALRSGLELLRQSDLRASLRRLQVPSLWLAGRRDRLVRPAAMQSAARECGGEFRCIEHGGHAPFLSYADEMADAISGFITVPA